MSYADRPANFLCSAFQSTRAPARESVFEFEHIAMDSVIARVRLACEAFARFRNGPCSSDWIAEAVRPGEGRGWFRRARRVEAGRAGLPRPGSPRVGPTGDAQAIVKHPQAGASGASPRAARHPSGFARRFARCPHVRVRRCEIPPSCVRHRTGSDRRICRGSARVDGTTVISIPSWLAR